MDAVSAGPIKNGVSAVQMGNDIFGNGAVVGGGSCLASPRFHSNDESDAPGAARGQQSEKNYEHELVNEISTLVSEIVPMNSTEYGAAARTALKENKAQLLLPQSHAA